MGESRLPGSSQGAVDSETDEQDPPTLDREQWELEKKERETKLRLEEEEREAQTRNRDCREKLFLGMAAITFVCALVAFVIGMISGKALILGGSGVTGVAALLATLRLLSSESQPPTPARK